MSVVAGKRGEGDLKVITVSGDLCDYTLQITAAEKHFPKRYRWSITNRILQLTFDIDDHIIHANSVYVRPDDGSLLRRQTHQLEALELNTKKTVIQPIRNGIHFLGFSFRLTETGKVLQTVLHKKISKEKRKLRKLVEKVKAGEMTREHVDECYKAWRAHVSKGNCRSLLSKMDAHYASLYT